MLKTPAEYPHAGSFALYVDRELEPGHQRAELVRILERGAAVALIAWPLRTGANGNRRVALADLIDGTPLNQAEQRELAELQRALRGRGRVPKKVKRAEELRSRAIWAPKLRLELGKFWTMESRGQPSRGTAVAGASA